ncbi:MAG: hypothetical protein ABSG01_09060 [Anaerolineales bacterium]|jgi:hypothetical protein
MNNLAAASPVAMIEGVILENGLHRYKFQQAGKIPDVEKIWGEFGPKDGQPFCLYTWMEKGIGYVYLAWKEWKIDPLPGMS